MEKPDFERIRKKLKGRLSEKRFQHTLGVEYTAAALAMCHGADMEKARLAGLLHDCAKEMYDDTKVAHAEHGPDVAEKLYGVHDKEVLGAIRWHTTGKEDMSLLEKIVYVADYIEPGRKMIPLLPAAREMAFKDITYTVYMIAENTLEYLGKMGNTIDDNTYRCCMWLKENGNHDGEKRDGQTGR